MTKRSSSTGRITGASASHPSSDPPLLPSTVATAATVAAVEAVVVSLPVVVYGCVYHLSVIFVDDK